MNIVRLSVIIILFFLHCTVWKLRKFTLTLSIWQKFRESNDFTKELISRIFISVRVNFTFFPHCVLLPTTTLIDFFASKVTINDARIVRKWNAYESLLTILLLETFWRKILRFDAFYFQLTMVVETKWMCCGYWKIIFGQG